MTPQPPHHLPGTAAPRRETRWHALPLVNTEQLEHLLDALRIAAAGRQDDLECVGCHRGTCKNVDHHQWMATAQTWWALEAHISAGATPINHSKPLVQFDAQACRPWLENGIAERVGIDHELNSRNASFPAVLEDLLYQLRHDTGQQAWRTHPPLKQVLVWPTADSDGVDGGAVVTADLTYGAITVRIATLHTAADEFTDTEETSGIDAAIQALQRTAAAVNREYANIAMLIAPAPATPSTSDQDRLYTVIGVWIGDRPVPVGVVEGRHNVYGGDQAEFPEGLWATTVIADDVDAAEAAGIAEMLECLRH